jgi:hypothetical protein
VKLGDDLETVPVNVIDLQVAQEHHRFEPGVVVHDL